jgi:hypothetical protein
VDKAHVRNVGDLEHFDYPPEQCRTVMSEDGLELFMISAAGLLRGGWEVRLAA